MTGRDALAPAVGRLLGPGMVQSGAAALELHAIDAAAPGVVVQPDSPQAVAELLAWAHSERLGVVPWGSGSHIGLGLAPTRYDIALSLRRLDAIVEHDVDNLTLTAAGGVALVQAARVTERHNQMPALAWPWQRQTFGGMIAANRGGAKRMRYGSLRDQVLGVRLALADGRLVRYGGKVLKNVAGYDMTKLTIGSMGALAVIVEATVKLFARPHREVYLPAAVSSLAHGARLAGKLFNGPLQPACMILLSPGGAARLALLERMDWPAGTPGLVVGFDGRSEAIRRQTADAAELISAGGGTPLPPIENLGETSARCLAELRPEPEGPDKSGKAPALKAGCAGGVATVRMRLGCPPGDLGQTLEFMERQWAERGLALDAVADYPAGAVILSVSVAEDGAVPGGHAEELVTQIRERLKPRGGFLAIEQGPPEFKRRMGVWGDRGSAAHVMRLCKARLDPRQILSPGRFPEWSGEG